MYLAGEPDREPLKKGASLMSQYHGGLNAYLGAVMALFARDDTGEGQHVDFSWPSASPPTWAGSSSSLPIQARTLFGRATLGGRGR